MRYMPIVRTLNLRILRIMFIRVCSFSLFLFWQCMFGCVVRLSHVLYYSIITGFVFVLLYYLVLIALFAIHDFFSIGRVTRFAPHHVGCRASTCYTTSFV